MIFLLASCAPKNKSLILLSKIETHLKKEHGIAHGGVVAAYDLGGVSHSKCLHTHNYGAVINDERQNSDYIKKLSAKCRKGGLEKRAKAKLIILKGNLARLHNKYNIFSISDARKLDFSDDEESIFDSLEKESGNYLQELHHIDQMIRHVPIFFPLHKARLTSNFGMRKHPMGGCKKFHYGTDFAGHKASDIYSAGYGRVISIERSKGYGNTVVIDHGKNFMTRYAHLSKILVEDGDKVIRGQKIGLQGKSGSATGEHLHFEVILRGKHLNPLDFVEHGYSCGS